MAQNTTALLTASQLSLEIADSLAVESVSLQLQRGEVLGLLGLNGAGKSSTLRMLAGVQIPTTGDITINGVSLVQQPLAAKQMVGYLPEIAPLYSDMRVDDFLHFAGRLRRMSRSRIRDKAAELLHSLHLEPFRRRRIGNLSKGYKQRLGLAQALIHDPALLILDEPSNGLDPEQMREMRDMIRSLTDDKGVIFSSHLLGEVTELCDRVSVLHHGKLVYEGKLGPEHSSTGRYIVKLTEKAEYADIAAINSVTDAEIVAQDTWAISIEQQHAASLLSELIGGGLKIAEFGPERPSLDMLFSSLINSEAAVEESLQWAAR